MSLEFDAVKSRVLPEKILGCGNASHVSLDWMVIIVYDRRSARMMWTQMYMAAILVLPMFITSSEYAAARPCTRIFSAEQFRAISRSRTFPRCPTGAAIYDQGIASYDPGSETKNKLISWLDSDSEVIQTHGNQ